MTNEIFTDIQREVDRQLTLWGLQDHPNGTGPYVKVGIVSERAYAASMDAKDANAWRAAEGILTWMDILYEEVLESFAEEDLERLRVELIQSAAVIVSWVKDIDRKAGAGE